jgi:hypothetical protein
MKIDMKRTKKKEAEVAKKEHGITRHEQEEA